jgi:transcriptional regulator with XRE-family HTH domain
MGIEGQGLAGWLGRRMSERGLGQRELAQATGLAVGTIWRILHGRGRPRRPIIETLAAYFGDDPVVIEAEAGLLALADAPAEARAEAAEILRGLYRLPPADRAAILHQINGILDLLPAAAPGDVRAPHASGDAPPARPSAESRPAGTESPPPRSRRRPRASQSGS